MRIKTNGAKQVFLLTKVKIQQTQMKSRTKLKNIGDTNVKSICYTNVGLKPDDTKGVEKE